MTSAAPRCVAVGSNEVGGLTNHPILSLPSSTLQEHAVRVPAANTQLQILQDLTAHFTLAV